MANEKIFLGLDIGTDSVGWAVTDGEYKLKKFKNNLMWGVHLFDEAQQSAERRTFRTARRRLDRRQQRILLLQELFAKEILKKDKKFFLRLKESALLPVDSENRNKNIFFDDENYGDKEYFKEYPTIHHLIVDLMENKKAHDIRLVYFACAYILAHRGHFLFNVDKENIERITDFLPIYDGFYSALTAVDDIPPFDAESDGFAQILKKHSSVTSKDKELKDYLFGGKVPKPIDEAGIAIKYDQLTKIISGGTVKLSDLFCNENYKDLEKNSVCIKNADFSDVLEILTGQIDELHFNLLASIKAMYDWSLLVDILNGQKMISISKVETYDKHKSDLKDLKYFIRKYLSQNDYSVIFREISEKANYSSYIYNAPSDDERAKYKKCSQEDFCKFLKPYIEKIEKNKISENDKERFETLKYKCQNSELCPKQVTTDNRVIPYQLYYIELNKILNNACSYLPFLNERDEYGTTAEKILSIMEFRVPYYVGPLVSSEKSKNAWMVRKAEGKIYPWNLNEKVDLDSSENSFIRRMTCKCTYLAGEDVIPKYSMLYSKYLVLNEINNIRINGIPISVEQKQKLYMDKFVNSKRKLTKKRILEYFISTGVCNEDCEISGVDDNIKSSLQSYHDFKKFIETGKLKEFDVERIIERITVTTDIARLKKWLKENYEYLLDEDIKDISKLKYNDYGRLSRSFLEEILPIDDKTGEILEDKNIISMLWDSNNNLMQILSSNYGYSNSIELFNRKYYDVPENQKSLSERLKEMYVPTSVRRSVLRALDVVKELNTINKKAPDKIFIEMARGNGDTPKGKRTISRREQITKIMNESNAENIDELKHNLENSDDGKLRSEKYYLYFMQLGKCAYTGKNISFEDLEDNHKWNIDHIWPQSRIKDDSIDNKVLVDSNVNGAKLDTYPIDESIRNKMQGFWRSLREKGLMSEKKYSRLIRNTRFTDDELSGFIARQLVETRQSTKAVATILKEFLPESDIVFVKAGLVSELRQEMDLLKCREINDLHHAKDAYLNIVMGNVYDTKFTKSPLNFIQSKEKYSMKLLKKDSNGRVSGLLSYKIERGDSIAWNPDTSFKIIREMMVKNSIRYVRYTYKRKGGFFDQMPKRKKPGLVSRKKDLDTGKYGGYNNATASFFTLIKFKEDLLFIPVDLIDVKDFCESKEKACEIIIESMKNFYSLKKMKSISSEDISFYDSNWNVTDYPTRIIKINSLFEIDGQRFCLKGKNDTYMSLSLATPLLLDRESEMYVKKIESFSQKYKDKIISSVSPFSGINKEMNVKIYRCIAEKCVSKPFSQWDKFVEAGEILLKGVDLFSNLNITEQSLALMKCLSILKTGRASNVDLSFVGGQKNFHTERFGLVLNKKKYKRVFLVDQSPTGLFEKKSVNLVEL